MSQQIITLNEISQTKKKRIHPELLHLYKILGKCEQMYTDRKKINGCLDFGGWDTQMEGSKHKGHTSG